MTDDVMLKELETYDKSFLEHAKLDQSRHCKFISKKCMKCFNHSSLFFDDFLFHICNDDWSGVDVGKHISYSETYDICLECDGFKSR
jgi:hypothetical protein